MIGRKPPTNLHKQGWFGISMYFAIAAAFLGPMLSGYLPFINSPATRVLCPDGSLTTKLANTRAENWNYFCVTDGVHLDITIYHYLLTGLISAALTFAVAAIVSNLALRLSK